MAKKKKQHEARYKDKTATVVLSLVERKLRAGEPLSEAHSAFLADGLAAMREGVTYLSAFGLAKTRGPKRKNLTRDLLIAERVDELKSEEGPHHTERTAFYLAAREFGMKDNTLETAYDKVKDTYEYHEYLRNKREPHQEPDYD